MLPEQDDTPLTFGLFAGITPNTLANQRRPGGPRWLVWAYENVLHHKVCSQQLYEQCLQESGVRVPPWIKDEKQLIDYLAVANKT